MPGWLSSDSSILVRCHTNIVGASPTLGSIQNDIESADIKPVQKTGKVSVNIIN